MNSNRTDKSPDSSYSPNIPIASISGVVVHGKGRGHTVGMPTANIQADNESGITTIKRRFENEKIPPSDKQFGNNEVPSLNSQSGGGTLLEGVYASIIHIGTENFLGVTNIGKRPTVDDEKTIETHILDFDRDIYGEKITIDLIEFLRGIRKFDSLEEVKKQVERDIARTREMGLPIQTSSLGADK